MTWRAHVDRFNDFLVMRRERADGVRGASVVVGFEYKDFLEGEIAAPIPSPIVGDEARQFLQAMMDCAYDIGLRPSRAQDERHLERHLQDMREIAFHKLGMRSGK